MEKTYTENGALSYVTTEDDFIDLFVKTVRNCSCEYIINKCDLCWKQNPKRLVQLIFLTRDPRNGKGERDITYCMLRWLKKNHPKTYELNILELCKNYGRFDDLLKLTDVLNPLELVIYANELKEDLKREHPSLAVKWAPRESNNKEYALKLAEILFPKNKSHCLEKYRKEILRPLAFKINVVETLMCRNRWKDINYPTVPSEAMRIYGREFLTKNKRKNGAFVRHDTTRYKNYLKDVKEGKSKINVNGIEPHKLVKQYIDLIKSHNIKEDEVIENLWKEIIERMKKNVKLESAIAIVDVSGSMYGTPMNVAIALGLIVASLVKEPFKNKVITFESEPNFVKIDEGTLLSKVQEIKDMSWGGSTNIIKTFDLILDIGKMFNVSKDNMIKTLFIFTDMQFDKASDDYDEKTIFEIVKDKYKKAGYDVPKIIFWNLRESRDAFPVTISENGTTFLSGYSQTLLNVFTNGCEFNPNQILENLLKRYSDVVVVDNSEI